MVVVLGQWRGGKEMRKLDGREGMEGRKEVVLRGRKKRQERSIHSGIRFVFWKYPCCFCCRLDRISVFLVEIQAKSIIPAQAGGGRFLADWSSKKEKKHINKIKKQIQFRLEETNPVVILDISTYLTERHLGFCYQNSCADCSTQLNDKLLDYS